LTILVAAKRRRLFFTGNDDSVYDRRSLNVTPKTTEQHLLVGSGKPEAEVTATIDCARGITLLKLTTADGHNASRGLSTIAELLVFILPLCTYFVIYILPVSVRHLELIYHCIASHIKRIQMQKRKIIGLFIFILRVSMKISVTL